MLNPCEIILFKTFKIFQNIYYLIKNNINPLSSLGEGVSIFTSPYLSAMAPAQGEEKGLIYLLFYIKQKNLN